MFENILQLLIFTHMTIKRQRDPAAWFSRITDRPEMGCYIELEGRLCFNAESDFGAGELLVDY